jgi:hypothetical protein
VTTYSQNIVVVKVSFHDYCYSNDNHLYTAELKLNDTLNFKKIIDTTYFEFTVPKYLLKTKFVTIKLTKFSDNEVFGSICFPYIGMCSNRYEPKQISIDTLLVHKEIKIDLKEDQSTVGCGSLPAIIFNYNSSNIDSALLANNYSADKPISLFQAKWDTYCIGETIKYYDTIKIIGNSGVYEKDPISLSLKRAEKIKEFFINNGIPSNKIKVIGNGNDRPIIRKDQLEKANKKDRQILDMKNARVLISGM